MPRERLPIPFAGRSVRKQPASCRGAHDSVVMDAGTSFASLRQGKEIISSRYSPWVRCWQFAMTLHNRRAITESEASVLCDKRLPPPCILVPEI